jgi:AcrR family transcriptional regulator
LVVTKLFRLFYNVVMARDREETKEKILQAVGKLLASGGFQRLGINAIAREAGVDKVLIYRYFDNLPALLKTFAQEGDYVGSLDGILQRAQPEQLANWASAMGLLTIGVLDTLKGNSLAQEIFRWELTEQNELTQELAASREELISGAIAWLRQQYPNIASQDVESISAVLLSSVTYLVLRSGSGKPFLGIDLNTPAGWQRIEMTIKLMLQGLANLAITDLPVADLPIQPRPEDDGKTD